MANQDFRVALLSESAVMPSRVHDGDAGFDICADESLSLSPGAHALVGTGVAAAVPDGLVAMVGPRSGLAARHGVTVLNAPGIVDSGYRGEIKVNLINHGTTEFTVRHGDRIAQLVLAPFIVPRIRIVASARGLGQTDRGTKGHGSTGMSARSGVSS